MNGRNYWTKWLRWWRRAPRRAATDDFADYGTAFGLDLSLEHERRKQSRTALPAEPSRPAPETH